MVEATADGVMGLATEYADANHRERTQGGGDWRVKIDATRAALESAVRSLVAALAEAERENERLRAAIEGVLCCSSVGGDGWTSVSPTRIGRLRAALVAPPRPADQP